MFYLRTREFVSESAHAPDVCFCQRDCQPGADRKLRERLNDMIKRRLSGELTICDQCMMNCADKENLIYDIDTTRLRS